MKSPNLAYRLKMARQAAEAYLRNNGHDALPIDPFAIAAKHDIDVKAKPDTAVGVSGMLLRHGDNFGILYATHTGSEGFERFSVGYELGHYIWTDISITFCRRTESIPRMEDLSQQIPTSWRQIITALACLCRALSSRRH
jgi:hypothetical protein